MASRQKAEGPWGGLHRSAGHAEDEEEEEEEVRDWIFDEGQTQALKDMSRSTSERARALVERQEIVLRNIQAKLIADAEHRGEEQRPASQQKLLPIPGGGAAASLSRGWRAESSSRQKRPDQQGASLVAQKLVEREERAALFDKRRQALLDEERNCKRRLAREQEDADAHFAQRRKATRAERQRKIYNLQSLRKEQQKVKLELEKEQERIREAYYIKNHPMEKATRPMRPQINIAWGCSPPDDPASPMSHASSAPSLVSKAPSLSAAGADAGGELEEDILKTTLQSHGLYDITMERWREYVFENDIRTQHYWQKMLSSVSDDSPSEQCFAEFRQTSEHSSRQACFVPAWLLEHRSEMHSRRMMSSPKTPKAGQPQLRASHTRSRGHLPSLSAQKSGQLRVTQPPARAAQKSGQLRGAQPPELAEQFADFLEGPFLMSPSSEPRNSDAPDVGQTSAMRKSDSFGSIQQHD